MKKRWIAAGLLLCLLWLLPACSSKDPIEVAQKALRRTAALDSCGMLLDVQLAAADDTAMAELSFAAELAVSRGKGGDSMSAASTVTKNGKKSTAAVYRTGDWFYITANGTSYKSNLPTFTRSHDYLAAVDAVLQEYPQTVWENARFDGDTLTLSPDVETLKALYQPIADDMWQALPGFSDFAADDAYTLADGTLVLTFSGKYVTACTLTLELKSGDVALVGVVMLRIPTPGSDVTVMPPVGYQYYPEYNFS
ncbi:MAG: hypothetical protein J6L87_03945 [Clostridia bacterium]|nr:hypothetical protein [Clostridia bacterium]